MQGYLGSAFALLVFVTVALTAFAIGLVTSTAVLRAAVGRWQFGWLILVNVAFVPLIGAMIAKALPLSPGVEIGVLLCAICSAGPIGLKASQIAKSNLAWALSLTLVLLSVNVIALPLWSGLLMDESLTLRPGDLLGTLALAIVLPVVVGVWLGRWRRERSDRIVGFCNAASSVTLLLAVVAGVASNARDLVSALDSWLIIAVVGVVAGAGFLGWAVPDEGRHRRSSTLATMNRATGVALLVVGRVFAGDADVFAGVVVFGLVQTALALGLSLFWRASKSRTAPVSEPGLTS